MRPCNTCLTDITQGPWLISGSLGVFSFLLLISSIHFCSSPPSYIIGPSKFELTLSPDVLLMPLLSLAALSLSMSILSDSSLALLFSSLWRALSLLTPINVECLDKIDGVANMNDLVSADNLVDSKRVVV